MPKIIRPLKRTARERDLPVKVLKIGRQRYDRAIAKHRAIIKMTIDSPINCLIS